MMQTSEYTFKETSFTYRYYHPSAAGSYLPTLLYLPASEEDTRYSFFVTEEFQNEHPCSVLVPEIMDWTNPVISQSIQRLLFDFRKAHPSDICRTYLVGAGYGAVGAWHMLGSYPRLFAAMIAIGGCGDPYHVRNAVYVPVRAYQSVKDPVIHISTPTSVRGKKYLAGSRRLIAALRTAGSELADYHEVPESPEELIEHVWNDQETWKWLFAQDRKNIVWITFIRPGIYRLDDWFMASAYLIEGEEKALLIDTTMTHAHLLQTVRQLTKLPVELAITHPHRDHMLHAFEFDTVYIHEADRQAMDECVQKIFDMKAGKIPQRPQTSTFPAYAAELNRFQHVVGLKDGDCIDLGGVKIEMIELGGHTQNHVVFADHTHRCLFTGDAVGSGYVVGVRYKENTFHDVYAWYRDNLKVFIRRMEGKEDYTCFGGHFIQENSVWDEMQEDYLNGQSEFFIPLSWEVIQDMYFLAQELAEGKHDAEAHLDTGEEFIAKHGSAMLAGSRIP